MNIVGRFIIIKCWENKVGKIKMVGKIKIVGETKQCWDNENNLGK